MRNLASRIKRYLRLKVFTKTKIFVIGFNKTGTTSVHSALLEYDIYVGNQYNGEILLDNVIRGDYEPLFEYCKEAEAFQDVPFSCPNVYKELYKKFPKSKFILTVRDDKEQWFRSLVNFHGKLWANGKVPSKQDLEEAVYIEKGYPLKYINYTFGESYYEKDQYEKTYLKHNSEVQEFFRNKPNKLLVINVSQDDSYIKFCDFIKKKPKRKTFEWKNKTFEWKNKTFDI